MALFITGTGTEIGKSFVTCLLIRQLRAQGKDVRAIKPVESGYDPAHPEMSDSYRLAEAMGVKWNEEMSPFRFRAPLAPPLAAEREGVSIPDEAVVTHCRNALAKGVSLIEGAGGVMSPLTDGMTNADLIQALRIPALLVAGSYLGSLSHTLSAYDSLRVRGIMLAGVVMNNVSEDEASDALQMLHRYLPEPCPILTLPHLAKDGTMAQDIPDLTGLI